jgi:ATP-dependent Clp protease ATP-binding subunit ClpB
MTSNLGAHLIQANYESLNESNRVEINSKTQLEVMQLLKQSIRPEFLNRIDEIIMFNPLSKKDIENIVHIQLQNLFDNLAEKGIKISATSHAIEWLSDEGYDPAFGARPLKRVIQKQILNELSKYLLAGKLQKDNEILLDVFDTKVVFRSAIPQV